MRDQVFISYSHKDKEWLERLQVVLKPLVRRSVVNVWDDTRIQTGRKWREEIKSALEAAKVAVLLVSPDFLASDFIAENELPRLLEASGADGLTIVWVPVRDSLYGETEIADYQAAHNPDQPLAGLSQAEVDRALVEISKKIKAAVEPPPPPISTPPREQRAPQPPSSTANRAGPGADIEQSVGAAPAPAPARAPAALSEILPGQWQVQIQTPMPGAVGQMRLQIFANGLFHGDLATPMGWSAVDGQWEVNPFTQQLGLQGRQAAGFQVIPYAVLMQVTFFDARQIVGVTSAGERVFLQKTG